jgi:RNA polymerase sigma-70 factor (ECF subfamily)
MTEQEYNQCVGLYADRLYRFVVKNLKHEENARDVVQNSFEILWKQHDELLFEKAKSYLFTVGYRNMIDLLRKEKRISLMDEFKEDAQVNFNEEQGLKNILQQALNRLNDIQKSLILLKDYEGYSYEEISEITGLNASQVKVYLHRARLKMKSYLVKMENVI